VASDHPRSVTGVAGENFKRESLGEEVNHIIEESRMVLPGIQALFGFQLIAVFNQRFDDVLPPAGRQVHLAAVVLVAIAIAFIMAPAAYHRQAERGSVSRYLAEYASRSITIALMPLLIAISLEIALVAFIVTHSALVAATMGILLSALFLWLWFYFPVRQRRSLS
jgi:hypothetical protein